MPERHNLHEDSCWLDNQMLRAILCLVQRRQLMRNQIARDPDAHSPHLVTGGHFRRRVWKFFPSALLSVHAGGPARDERE